MPRLNRPTSNVQRLDKPSLSRTQMLLPAKLVCIKRYRVSILLQCVREYHDIHKIIKQQKNKKLSVRHQWRLIFLYKYVKYTIKI